MTEQLTVAETFIVELASAGVGLRLTSALTYAIDCAVREQGWTVQQLVTEATRDLDTAANPGAVITDRIRIAATVPPPRAARSKTGLPKAHDGCCEDGWIYDETTDPPTSTKCPGARKEALT